MPMQILSTFERLPQARILIVGDLILDHYVYGSTERTSPEAPVPVVLFSRDQYIPGGAANVARNITAIGAEACLCGCIGNDDFGKILRDQLVRTGAKCDSMVTVTDRPTTTKTRIVSPGQQVVRVDREVDRPYSDEVERDLLGAVEKAVDNCDAIILSDYAKGVLSLNLTRNVIELAKARQLPVLVDPKGRDYTRYAGATIITPNAREAYEATGIRTDSDEGLTRAAERLHEVVQCDAVVITRGAQGVGVFEKDKPPLLMPTFARDVYDVTGAGDTFVAFLAMGSASGLSLEASARFANAAAGVAVGKAGAATVALSDLRSALLPGRLGRKLRTVAELGPLGEALRKEGKRIVFTNGCFDFLHAGHVSFMEKARALGDVLVLATNTDEVITRLKGRPRPIIRQVQRQALLAAIESVDYVVPFTEETPHAAIAALRPDLLVKGSNYTHEEVEGHEIVRGYGGEVRLLDVLEDFSTKDLLAQWKAGE